jgi:hypothetical protein
LLWCFPGEELFASFLFLHSTPCFAFFFFLTFLSFNFSLFWLFLPCPLLSSLF